MLGLLFSTRLLFYANAIALGWTNLGPCLEGEGLLQVRIQDFCKDGTSKILPIEENMGQIMLVGGVAAHAPFISCIHTFDDVSEWNVSVLKYINENLGAALRSWINKGLIYSVNLTRFIFWFINKTTQTKLSSVLEIQGLPRTNRPPLPPPPTSTPGIISCTGKDLQGSMIRISYVKNKSKQFVFKISYRLFMASNLTTRPPHSSLRTVPSISKDLGGSVIRMLCQKQIQSIRSLGWS